MCYVYKPIYFRIYLFAFSLTYIGICIFHLLLLFFIYLFNYLFIYLFFSCVKNCRFSQLKMMIIIIVAYETIKDNFPLLIAKCRKTGCFSLIIRNLNLISWQVTSTWLQHVKRLHCSCKQKSILPLSYKFLYKNYP